MCCCQHPTGLERPEPSPGWGAVGTAEAVLSASCRPLPQLAMRWGPDQLRPHEGTAAGAGVQPLLLGPSTVWVSPGETPSQQGPVRGQGPTTCHQKERHRLGYRLQPSSEEAFVGRLPPCDKQYVLTVENSANRQKSQENEPPMGSHTHQWQVTFGAQLLWGQTWFHVFKNRHSIIVFLHPSVARCSHLVCWSSSPCPHTPRDDVCQEVSCPEGAQLTEVSRACLGSRGHVCPAVCSTQHGGCTQ